MRTEKTEKEDKIIEKKKEKEKEEKDDYFATISMRCFRAPSCVAINSNPGSDKAAGITRLCTSHCEAVKTAQE